MNSEITPAVEIRDALKDLSQDQLKRLAVLSGVPYFTILKIRSGETINPGIETVRKFWPHIESARAEEGA